MKKEVLLLFFLLVPAVSAIGISPATMRIAYLPGESSVMQFEVINTGSTKLTLTPLVLGEDRDYFKIIEESITIGPRSTAFFKVRANFPNSAIKPGMHSVSIGVTDLPITSDVPTSAIGTVVTVNAIINFFVPYPGKYVEITKFTIDNTNLDDDLPINLMLTNLGKETVNLIEGNLELSTENEIVQTIPIITKNLASQTSFEFKMDVPTTTFSPGDYFGRLTFRYDGITSASEVPFRIGTFFVKLLNYTRLFEKDKISRFDIEIENSWGRYINGTSAEVLVFEGESLRTTFKTPSIDLKPWSRDILWTFFDTKGLAKGDYKIITRIQYGDQSYEETGKITIYEKFKIDATKLLIGVIIFLIALDLIWFLFMRHKKDEEV